MGNRTTFVAYGCPHVPITNESWFEFLLATIEEYQPDYVVNCGDFPEGLAAKRWPKHPQETWTLFDEHRGMLSHAKRIREASPRSKKIWIYGNHCANIYNEPHRIPEDLRSVVHWSTYEPLRQELEDWTIIQEYAHSVRFRLGPVTFQHGCETGKSGGKDQCYEYASPWGLHVSAHTHQVVPVTQCEERSVYLPYWYANVGTGMDYEKHAHYMRRARLYRWGRACIVGDCAGVGQRRTAYASKQWDAEVRVHSYASNNRVVA